MITIYVDEALNENKEYAQQLIRKEITRKEFKENTAKLYDNLSKKVGNRCDADIRNGIYTGEF